MNAQDAIKLSIDTGEMMTMAYIGDLSDADLLIRPVPGCNHINWQIGHLIVAENGILSKIAPDAAPPLPAGFAEKYTKETATIDDPKAFCSKEELLRVKQQQRDALLAYLKQTTAEDLSKPSGLEWAPTVGAASIAAGGGHWLMHCGQYVVVRRKLGHKAMF